MNLQKLEHTCSCLHLTNVCRLDLDFSPESIKSWLSLGLTGASYISPKNKSVIYFSNFSRKDLKNFRKAGFKKIGSYPGMEKVNIYLKTFKS